MLGLAPNQTGVPENKKKTIKKKNPAQNNNNHTENKVLFGLMSIFRVQNETSKDPNNNLTEITDKHLWLCETGHFPLMEICYFDLSSGEGLHPVQIQ